MPEFWETAFADKQLMWGLEPARSAVFARDWLGRAGAKEILIPGVGYGRNARPFLDRGMSVTGIEISETAIGLARSQLGLDIPIHHGPVAGMPYDERRYDGIFCHALIQLLDADARAKLVRDCHDQLAPGGHMIFTCVSKEAPMYGKGARLGDDRYEVLPGVQMYFYDGASIDRDFAPHGLLERSPIDEPMPHGGSLPFFVVVCGKS